MIIEQLYWSGLWADAVKRTTHNRRGPTALERQAFERRMRKLHDKQFVRHPSAVG